MNPNRASLLRNLLNGNQLVMAPGVFDPLSARIVEQTGFPAVYMTGAGVASSRLGVPDIGLATMNEVLETAKNIAQVTTIPLICDIDTGFGNAIYPVSAWTAAIAAMQNVLAELKQKGTTEGFAENMVSFKEMFEVVGLNHYRELQSRFLSSRLA